LKIGLGYRLEENSPGLGESGLHFALNLTSILKQEVLHFVPNDKQIPGCEHPGYLSKPEFVVKLTKSPSILLFQSSLSENRQNAPKPVIPAKSGI